MIEFLKEKPLPVLVLVFLFIVLGGAVVCSNYWHSLVLSTNFGPSVYLVEYDSTVFEREQACFLVEYYPSKFDINKSTQLFAFSNGTNLISEEVKFSEEKQRKKACFDSSLLKDGNNLVEIFTHYNTLFFHLEKKTIQKPSQPKPTIEIESVDSGKLFFSVNNFPTHKIAPIKITVNGKLDHKVYPKNSSEKFSEKLKLKEGENEIRVEFNSIEASVTTIKESGFKMPPFLGILFILLSFFVFCFFVFPKEKFYKRIPVSLALTVSLFVVLVFLLGQFDFLGAVPVTVCFLLVLLGISFIYRKNFSFSLNKKLKRVDLLLLFALLVFVFISTVFHFFTYQHMTYWNGFYERMGEMIVEQNAIPRIDPLSFFGRGFTFVPGYFYFNAAVSWLTGLSGTALFAIILAFSNLIFFFSVYYLGKSLKLSGKQSALLSLIVIVESFVLTAVTLSPRHALAFGLFVLSLALLFDKKTPILSGLVLGTAGFIQAPLLLFFPFFALIVAREFNWKQTLFTLLVSGTFFFLLFLPNLFIYGLPYQVEASYWGYLIKVPLNRLWKDFSPLVLFFVFFYLVDLWKKRIRLNAYSKKLLVGVFLGFLIQLFVTYRYNILTGLNIGLLLALWFPVKKLEDIHFERILIIFLLLVLTGVFLTVQSFSIQGIAVEPMQNLEHNTSTDSRILTDPLFGHSIAFFAERKVLADLHVEYADQQKLVDSYEFLEEKDYSILKKYSIDYTVNQSDYINRQAMEGKLRKQPIEFRHLDKIFSNGFIFIHRNRGQWK